MIPSMCVAAFGFEEWLTQSLSSNWEYSVIFQIVRYHSNSRRIGDRKDANFPSLPVNSFVLERHRLLVVSEPNITKLNQYVNKDVCQRVLAVISYLADNLVISQRYLCLLVRDRSHICIKIMTIMDDSTGQKKTM